VLFAASCGSGGYGTNRGDPLVGYQWYLQNVGQDVFTGVPGTPGIDLDVIPPLSAGVTGHGVNVMVVDTGVEILHPDLKDRIDSAMLFNFELGALDMLDPTPPVGRDPYETGDPHGTAVAGIIAATADNGLGGHGVAPQATLGAARFISVRAVERRPTRSASSAEHHFRRTSTCSTLPTEVLIRGRRSSMPSTPSCTNLC
jgi:subtilisin family serine protease